jgi:hypothetical protein
LDEPFQRVRRLDLPDGRRFWLKRVERLTGVMRAQKGDPAKAFEAERQGLHALADAGLPVAEVTAEGPDWMLMPDAGPVLTAVVADPRLDDAGKRTAFEAAGRSLGRLHWAGLVHGRPAVRDICWDGSEAAYAVSAPEGAMDRVRRLAIWLLPLGWIASGAARLKPESRELRAVGLTLRRLRG